VAIYYLGNEIKDPGRMEFFKVKLEADTNRIAKNAIVNVVVR
jgi:hypothetical protein